MGRGKRPARKRLYLENVTVGKALEVALHVLDGSDVECPLPAEEVPVVEALARVTARPVFARLSSPHYPSAAMDGVAVRARDTYAASEVSPVYLEEGRQAVQVNTGEPLPAGYDAVIMTEDLHPTGDGRLEITAPAVPWQHVRGIGEDIVATELLLPENHRLRPWDLGALVAAGITAVPVRRRPRVAIIPTGDELVALPGTGSGGGEKGRGGTGEEREDEKLEALRPGSIVEYNSLVLSALVTEAGGEPVRYPIVPDAPGAIRGAVERALSEADLVLLNAGSSAGTADYGATVIEDLGEVLVHGVAMRPGKPVIIGRARGKPVFGLPGYPVSAVLAFELFVAPLLARLQGTLSPRRPVVRAALSRRVASPMGTEEFLRVAAGRVGGRMVAIPLARGAGVLTSLVRAHGLVRIPALSQGIGEGEEIEVELFCDPQEVENTLLAVGSHDLVLDLLATHLRRLQPPVVLSSANVGSLGGLMAVRRGEAHLAGSHLLDEQTGDYNLSYVRRYVPGRRVVLVTLAHRQQGLMVAPGNPRGLQGIQDLARDDVAFVNRQRGAGTRILLDFLLRQEGLSARDIRGYDREEYTHTAVAAAVAGGTADAGLGILAAARALGLDFVPVTEERYELVIPAEHYEHQGVQRLLEVIRSPAFQDEVLAMGGYDIRETGRERWVEEGGREA